MEKFNVLLVRTLKIVDYDLSFRNTFLNVSNDFQFRRCAWKAGIN